MKFTQPRLLKRLLLVAPLIGTLSAGAQNNIAPAATVTHHIGGQPGGGVGLKGPHNYNDGFIGDYPGTFVGTVNAGGTIEFEWPTEQRFNRIVVYQGQRPFSSAVVEIWDGSAWQQAGAFKGANPEADSITIQATPTTKLRISKFENQNREPVDIREIMIRRAVDRYCSSKPSPGKTAVADKSLVCYGEEVLFVAGDYSLDAYFQWQVDDGNGWVDIPGATDTWYRMRATQATPARANYRLTASCDKVSYNPSQVELTVEVNTGNNATFAAVPYSYGFEQSPWGDYCGQRDVPAINWTADNVKGVYRWKSSDDPDFKQGNFPAPPEGKLAARFSSTFAGNQPNIANLDLHVDCSKEPGGHNVSFSYVNPLGKGANGNDFLIVLVSTDGGKNFTPIGGWEEEDKWSDKYLQFYSASPNTIIRFKGYTQTTPGIREDTDLGIDNISVAPIPPCAGNPSQPTVTPSSVTLCAGQSTMLTGGNIDQVTGITLQWQQSTDGGISWTNVVGGSGASDREYTTPILYDTIHYRLQVNCTTPGKTGSSVSTAAAVLIPAPVYAKIPFVESFEEWTKRCDVQNDVPSLHWVSTPFQGGNSWRRDDEGVSAWGTDYNGTPLAYHAKYDPPAFEKDHSARFHTYGNAGRSGTLDLFVDCSTHPGDKELSFALNLTREIPTHPNNNNPPPSAYDYLIVYLSTDGAQTFTQLERFDGPAFSQWEIKSINIPSNSPTTVIRFEATSVVGYRDMGLDYVRVMPACSGQPTAGIIEDVSPCADKDFFLKLDGASQNGGLTYQWQRSTNGSTWINMPGTGSSVYSTQINANTFFRAIVTCPSSGLKDTTPVKLVELAPFYYCYCDAGFDPTRPLNYNMNLIHCGKAIGNVTIVTQSNDTVLNNGNYMPWFSHPEIDFISGSDYRKTLPPTPLYLGDSYDFTIHSIHTSTVGSKPVKWAAYIDYNQDGIYDTLTERIWIDLNKNTDTRPAQGSGTPYHTYNFTVPSNVKVGVTGMRVVMMGGSCTNIEDWNEGPTPCNLYADGEVEDYLVELKFPECNGAPQAGTTTVSHTEHCPGYTVTLHNTNHQAQNSSIGWDWQYSPDGSNWTAISNSDGKDTIDYVLSGNSQFRLRIWCSNTEDTAYSNVATVTMKEPYKCYCYSEATGKMADSSDAGVVTIAGETFGTPGGHLNNASAVYGRTDYTDNVIQIDISEPLEVALTHILRSSAHADAKVTMFIDFDNNLQYDIPDERVWSTSTTSSSWNLSTSVSIPANVVTGKPTGLRIIVNNDTAPNVPSDEACGPYISGETEDYVVVFTGTPQPETVAQSNSKIERVVVFPNPASKNVYVQYFGGSKEKATISVLSVTGQVLKTQEWSNVANHSIVELNLEGLANGVYYVRFATSSGYVNEKLTLIGK